MRKIWGKKVLLPEGWSKNTAIEIDNKGKINQIIKNAEPSKVFFDTLIPSPMNLHSHCFQRAMNGLSERSIAKFNDFWSWRSFMYNFLNKINPDNFESICEYAQMEMLEAGYAGITEFHYIHNNLSGIRYKKLGEMAQRVINSSYNTGIGLTLLPVLYEHGSVSGAPLVTGQDRFGLRLEEYLLLFQEISAQTKKVDDLRLGVAAHSLRTVKKDSLIELGKLFSDCPIHIHVAEQKMEVEEIFNAWGRRPIEWLIENIELNNKWCLVHCTQMTNTEAELLAQTGSIIGLCPITEANLGDGIFNGKKWIKHGGRFGIGTDSNVKISLFEELRTLEYSQRLKNKKRIVLQNNKNLTIGRNIINSILEGGSLASGRKTGKIKIGYWADILALDLSSFHYLGLENDEKLNYLIFSESDNVIESVFSAGRWLVKNGQHINNNKITSNYENALKEIFNDI